MSMKPGSRLRNEKASLGGGTFWVHPSFVPSLVVKSEIRNPKSENSPWRQADAAAEPPPNRSADISVGESAAARITPTKMSALQLGNGLR